MGIRHRIEDQVRSWPVYRQLTGTDRLGRGEAAKSRASGRLAPRTADGRPRGQVGLPVLRGRLRPERLRQGRAGHPDRGRPRLPGQPRAGCAPRARRACSSPPARAARYQVLYRRPHGTDWETLDLDTAMDMIADRVIDAAPATAGSGRPTASRRPPHAGHRQPRRRDARQRGELPDQEAVHGARARSRSRTRPAFDTPPPSPVWGPRSAAAARRTFQQDLQNADCIVIQGSNMAECHPVGFQWVMEAKARGATVIHVDPRFTRTSALADLHVPLRAGTDIAFLGGIINYVLQNEQYFREYVARLHQRGDDRQRGLRATPRTSTACSPASTREHRHYDPHSWQYEGADVQAAAGRAGPAYERPEPARHAGRPPPRRGARLRRRRRRRRRAASATRRCSTRAACSRCSSGTSPATPRRWSSRSAACPPELFRQVCELLTANSRPGAHHRLRLRGRLDPAHRRRAVHPHRGDPAAAARQHRAARAAASWRCAGTLASRAPPTSRRCSTCCPATSRCRTRTQHEDLDAFVEAEAADEGLLGATCAPTPVSLLKA